MPLFCRMRTTTRRFSAWPSAVLSESTWDEVPMGPGASIGEHIGEGDSALLLEGEVCLDADVR